MCFPLALCRDPSKEHELFTRDDQELEPDHRDRQRALASRTFRCAIVTNAGSVLSIIMA